MEKKTIKVDFSQSGDEAKQKYAEESIAKDEAKEKEDVSTDVEQLSTPPEKAQMQVLHGLEVDQYWSDLYVLMKQLHPMVRGIRIDAGQVVVFSLSIIDDTNMQIKIGPEDFEDGVTSGDEKLAAWAEKLAKQTINGDLFVVPVKLAKENIPTGENDSMYWPCVVIKRVNKGRR